MSTIEPRREMVVTQINKKNALKIHLTTSSMLVVFWAVLAIAGWLSILFGGLS
jgi:hypothetical protein